MSSKAVAKDAIEDGAVSRREGFRVEVEETTERISESLSRLVRVESLFLRRRSSSLSLLEAEDEPVPVSLLHMMDVWGGGVKVNDY